VVYVRYVVNEELCCFKDRLHRNDFFEVGTQYADSQLISFVFAAQVGCMPQNNRSAHHFTIAFKRIIKTYCHPHSMIPQNIKL
jgi:hypothetical protein